MRAIAHGGGPLAGSRHSRVSWSCKKHCVCDPRTSPFPSGCVECSTLWWCLCRVGLGPFISLFCVFSTMFFSFESFLRFHCVGTSSTCLTFKLLLLNCTKKRQSKSRAGLCCCGPVWSNLPAAPWCPPELAMPKPPHPQARLVGPVARPVLSVTPPLSCWCLPCAPGLLCGGIHCSD